MTPRHAQKHQPPPSVEALGRELRQLLPQAAFHATKGSYVRGDLVAILVDTQPGDVPGTFHAGLTVLPLTDEPVDLAGLSIALIGRLEGPRHIRPLRRGGLNRRGSMTHKDLPVGQYRLFLAQSLVASGEPLPLQRTASSFALAPSPLIFREYQAEDGALTCFLRETREGELLLYFATSLAEAGDVWAEYMIVEEDSEQVAAVERDGDRVELAGRVVLRPDPEGHYTAHVSLGHSVTLARRCTLRAYLVPGGFAEEGHANGQPRAS